MERISSLASEHPMISSDHNRHLLCQFLGFREIKMMPRMKKIESSEAHHMRVFYGVF
jgi:hypothetical protein